MRHLLMPLDARTAISMPIYTQFKKNKENASPCAQANMLSHPTPYTYNYSRTLAYTINHQHISFPLLIACTDIPKHK